MRPEHTPPADLDESAESEITIGPDGRVFAFGITRQLVGLLATIPTGDERVRRKLERLSVLGEAPTLHEPLVAEKRSPRDA